MRRRVVIGLIACVGAILAGRAVTLAQRPATPVMVFNGEPKGWKGQTRPEMKSDLPPAAGDEPVPLPQAGPPAVAEPADPMAAVDSFLDRNRKEADDAIQALSREAEALRSRLQKVEAALARWQGVAAALNQPVAVSPQLEPVESPKEVRPPSEPLPPAAESTPPIPEPKGSPPPVAAEPPSTPPDRNPQADRAFRGQGLPAAPRATRPADPPPAEMIGPVEHPRPTP